MRRSIPQSKRMIVKERIEKIPLMRRSIPHSNRMIVKERFEKIPLKMALMDDFQNGAKSSRNFLDQMKTEYDTVLGNIVANAKVGVVGTRGEAWFVAEVICLSFILLGIFPMPWPIQWLGLNSVGISLWGSGIFLSIGAIAALKPWVSPFSVPVENNELQTEGVYAVIRHPIYGGLILMTTGLAVFTHSVERCLLTVLLAYILDHKASMEEKYLIDKHGKKYEDYQAKITKKLLPFIL